MLSDPVNYTRQRGGAALVCVVAMAGFVTMYDVKKQKTVPPSDLPAGTKEGDVLKDHAGQPATVTQLSDSSAVMDYNHPLAGRSLVVNLKILRVENPS